MCHFNEKGENKILWELKKEFKHEHIDSILPTWAFDFPSGQQNETESQDFENMEDEHEFEEDNDLSDSANSESNELN